MARQNSPLFLSSPSKIRLDAHLVEIGAFVSRARAQAAVRAGFIQIDGSVVHRPSLSVKPEMRVEILGDVHPYVSRGGLKLEAALEAFGINPRDNICLDLGASTGGFTDVLLRQGATRVFAVDVGRGQLHEKLRKDDRVTSLEGTHANALSKDIITEPIELLVCDVSFISLTKVLPHAFDLCASHAAMVALVKPQFEVGPENIGKGGIVSEAVGQTALTNFIEWLNKTHHWEEIDWCDSPIRGGDGNKEFLVGARKTA
ncbi:MAG: TlyA family RNA methyltransferase [Pseudomonadota bacterium]